MDSEFVEEFNEFKDGLSEVGRGLEKLFTNNPKRLFSMEEYHWSGISGIFVGVILFLPFVLAGFTAILLRIDI